MQNTVKRIIGPTILLSSGAYFDYEAPHTSDFTIEDIAHGLSMTCRFAGHCIRHYSVAQHSVHLSHLIGDARYSFEALMHDASEFAVGDMAKPLKVMLPEYSVIEKRVEAAIFERFRIEMPLPSAIKEADYRMLRTEQSQLMNNNDIWTHTQGRDAYNFVIPTWSPEQAKAEFLQRYSELTS